MAVDIPISDALEALRALAQDAFGLLAGRPIPESGGIPVRLQDYGLPFCCLRADGELTLDDEEPSSQGVGTLLSIGETIDYQVWIFRRRTGGLDDTRLLRDDALVPFAQAVLADRTLGGTVTRAYLVSMNWTGEGVEWPVELEAGEHCQAGYVRVRLHIEDQ